MLLKGITCLSAQPCCCAKWMDQYPALQNCDNHVIFRSTQQWVCVFGSHAGQVLGSHARRACLPTPEHMRSHLCTLENKLATMRLPLAPHDTSIADKSIDDLMSDITSITAHDVALLEIRFPDLQGLSIQHIAFTVHKAGIVSGVFDKRLFTISGVYKNLGDMHYYEDVIFGSKFTVWGWGSNPFTARVLAVKEILDRARHNGVLAQAASLGLGHPAYLLQGPATSFFDKLLLDPECRLSWSPQLFPPSLFTMLKWKSVETGSSPLGAK